MTPNSDIAAIVSTAFYAIWNIFAGFIIPRPVSPTQPSLVYNLYANWYESTYNIIFSTLPPIFQNLHFTKLKFVIIVRVSGFHNIPMMYLNLVSIVKVLKVILWVVTEDSNMVEMVLLGMSGRMDLIRARGFAIRGLCE